MMHQLVITVLRHTILGLVQQLITIMKLIECLLLPTIRPKYGINLADGLGNSKFSPLMMIRYQLAQKIRFTPGLSSGKEDVLVILEILAI